MEWMWIIPMAGISTPILMYSFGRINSRISPVLGIIAIGVSFGLFWPLLVSVLKLGSVGSDFTWINLDALHLTWGITADPLAIVMIGLITFASLGIQIYSWSYMKGDPRIHWYFILQSMFASSMLLLVLADSLLLLYIFWEIVGLCSYLLIGFWYERRSAAEAAKKAFITTRLGDVGLLIGILLLFSQTGTFNISEIIAIAQSGELSDATILASSCLIFLGAMGKSAQFPFHVWLPDAMEGPTPVSALIHAATMVVAGIYLVARLFPLFAMNDSVMLGVTVFGVLTALLGGTIALVMTDLKRILAYSTITDLGFMMLALGAGSVTAAMFHLLTHGFAKATLFLAAGSISHGTGQTDIRTMGGLRGKMPITALVFGIAALSLAGIPPLSGFFSKDEVLLSVLHGRGPIFMTLTLLICFLKALYMSRCVFKIFFGTNDKNVTAHDPSILMSAPMSAFALLTLGLGVLAPDLPGLYQGFGTFLYGSHPIAFEFHLGLVSGATVVAIAGLGLGWVLYVKNRHLSPKLASKFDPAYRILINQYYVDQLYQWAIDKIILTASKFIALFDRIVINDIGVNGSAETVVKTANHLRKIQTGKVSAYALAMIVGFTFLVLIWWIAS